MKRKEFYDIAQADSYLSNSVIRIGEDPIYVHRVYTQRTGPVISYWKLGSVGGAISLKEIKLDDPDINMNPVSLGMLATGKESKATIYCSRVSRRAWKIGLSSGSLDLTNISNERKKNIRFSKNHVLYSTSLMNTIKGDYLPYEAAMKLSKEEGLPIAFSRSFAVWGDDLYYKYIGQPIGVNKKTLPNLEEGFEWLTESLQEDLNG